MCIFSTTPVKIFALPKGTITLLPSEIGSIKCAGIPYVNSLGTGIGKMIRAKSASCACKGVVGFTVSPRNVLVFVLTVLKLPLHYVLVTDKFYGSIHK